MMIQLQAVLCVIYSTEQKGHIKLEIHKSSAAIEGCEQMSAFSLR